MAKYPSEHLILLLLIKFGVIFGDLNLPYPEYFPLGIGSAYNYFNKGYGFNQPFFKALGPFPDYRDLHYPVFSALALVPKTESHKQSSKDNQEVPSRASRNISEDSDQLEADDTSASEPYVEKNLEEVGRGEDIEVDVPYSFDLDGEDSDEIESCEEYDEEEEVEPSSRREASTERPRALLPVFQAVQSPGRVTNTVMFYKPPDTKTINFRFGITE